MTITLPRLTAPDWRLLLRYFQWPEPPPPRSYNRQRATFDRLVSLGLLYPFGDVDPAEFPWDDWIFGWWTVTYPGVQWLYDHGHISEGEMQEAWAKLDEDVARRATAQAETARRVDLRRRTESKKQVTGPPVVRWWVPNETGGAWKTLEELTDDDELAIEEWWQANPLRTVGR